MAELPSWDDLLEGRGCPLCHPRADFSEFTYLVRKLAVSTLYLNREQTRPGACILIYDVRHIVRLDELTSAEWLTFANDLGRAEEAVYRAMKPDHMNVESLGNQVPHLHWHIVPRYRGEERWRAPIWTTRLEEMPNQRLTDGEYAALASRIDAELE
jgi:diadenosine tetraphosphate (Ap4A) HIT family hydrolase